MRVALSTRNARATALNFYDVPRRVRRDAVRVVRQSGERLRDNVLINMLDMGIVDTGFMMDKLRLDFTESRLAHEVGWRESDFTSAGRPWYPPYVVFGTTRMAPRDPIFGARDEELPRFRAELADVLREAARTNRSRA